MKKDETFQQVIRSSPSTRKSSFVREFSKLRDFQILSKEPGVNYCQLNSSGRPERNIIFNIPSNRKDGIMFDWGSHVIIANFLRLFSIHTRSEEFPSFKVWWENFATKILRKMAGVRMTFLLYGLLKHICKIRFQLTTSNLSRSFDSS